MPGNTSVALTLAGLTVAYLAAMAALGFVRKDRAMPLRHAVSATAMWAVAGLFLWLRDGFEGVHWWNRAFADASLVLYAVALAIGPLARLWRPASAGLAWRRELGIWGTLAAVVHVWMYWDWVFQFDWKGFFYDFRQVDTDAGASRAYDATVRTDGQEPARRLAFRIANWVGLFALAYGIILAVTSNDASQRLLGRGWSWLMARSTTMWVLVLLHTWLFASIGYAGGRWVTPLLLWCFCGVLVLQIAGFARTVGGKRAKAA